MILKVAGLKDTYFGGFKYDNYRFFPIRVRGEKRAKQFESYDKARVEFCSHNCLDFFCFYEGVNKNA